MAIPASSVQPQSAKRTSARIKIIFGGNSLSIARYKRLLKKYDLVIVIDVRGEISHLLREIDSPNLITISLGDGETARSLVQDAPSELKACVDCLPGISTSFGMAGIRGMGGWATTRFVRSSAFAALVNSQIVPRLLKAKVAISEAWLEVELGGSGGMGSLGALVFGVSLGDLLHFRLGVVVKGVLRITGGVTSADLGPNTRFNAAANIIDVADLMLNGTRSLHESWAVVFRENPAVGTDRAERDRFVLMAEQALTASSVERELLLLAPNQGGGGRFGNMATLQLGFGQALDLRLDVAPDHARPLREALARLLAAPLLPVIAELRTPTNDEELPQEPVDHLVERAWDTDPEELVEAATQPRIQSSAAVEVVLHSGAVIDLLQTRRQFAVPPTTGSEAGQRLSLIRTCLAEVVRHQEALAEELKELERLVARSFSRLETAIARIHPKTIFAWLLAFLSTAAGKERRLARAIEAFREADEQRIQIQAQVDALEEARQQLEEEFEFLVGRLTAMDEILSRFCLSGEAERAIRYVTTLPLDEVFSELWQLDVHDDDQILLKAICGATEYVTLHGLAKTVGADSPRLDVIAQHIASRQFMVLGPAWGGSPQGGEPLCVHVLPPLDPKTGRTLAAMLRQLDGSLVCVADDAVAAVNIVDLYFYPVQERHELLPGYYASSLVQIVNSDKRALFFPDGLGALDRLRMQVIGDQLVFLPLD